VSLFWPVYVRWGWRWPLACRLFDRPDLTGTWVGELTTDWRGPDGQPVGPRKLVLVVRQTLLYVYVTSFTDYFIGISYAETLRINRERGLRKLVYLYARDSTAVGETWNREGVSELLIEGNPSEKMNGQYWTNTKTGGRISVTRQHQTCGVF
jgi:predicted pore-forming effector associated with SMODS systems